MQAKKHLAFGGTPWRLFSVIGVCSNALNPIAAWIDWNSSQRKRLSAHRANSNLERVQFMSINTKTDALPALWKLTDVFESKAKLVGFACDWFRKIPPRVLYLLTVGALVMAIYCGWEIGQMLFASQDSLERTLKAELVSTAYPHRGVTPFVVADHEKTMPADRSYSPQLTQAINDIANEIKATTDHYEEFDKEEVVKRFDPKVNNIESKPGPDSNSTWQKAVSSNALKGAFLMVPGISVRQLKVGTEKLDDTNVDKVLMDNPEILFDFHIASRIDKKLSALNNVTVQSLTIVQVYFISESGFIFLRSLPINYGDGSYDFKFPRYTFFADRVYFWGAIDPHFPKDKDSPFDYHTNPYVDLGGNGIVKTYSRKVLLPNHRVGVICVDALLSKEPVTEIRQRLISLGATVSDASWTIGPTYNQKEGHGDDVPGFHWVGSQLGISEQEQARILGAIAFQDDYPPDPGDGPPDNVVRFTVPIGSKNVGGGKTTTNLLLVSFDASARKQTIFLYFTGFISGIFVLALATTTLIWHYTVLERSMKGVLDKMSDVMREAATPFARLDGKNRFVDANFSFLKLVDCLNLDELRNHAPTFRQLVTAETQQTYDAILEQSGKGEKTPKYTIDIITKNNEVIRVWAHGSGYHIPAPAAIVPHIDLVSSCHHPTAPIRSRPLVESLLHQDSKGPCLVAPLVGRNSKSSRQHVRVLHSWKQPAERGRLTGNSSRRKN